jgi:hypothetical protein
MQEMNSSPSPPNSTPNHDPIPIFLREQRWRAGGADVTLHIGDCLDVMRTLPDASVDADGEVSELLKAARASFMLTQDPADYPVDHWIRRAADLLQRLQPPQPVAVSERLPGPEDCDAEGRCWWEFAGSDEFGPSWTLVKMHGIPSDMTRWLSVWVHALPIPRSEND